MSEFKRQAVTNPQVFLEAALEAENYIKSVLVETENGIYSEEHEGPEKDNFYSGTAGILHMYAQLYRVAPSQEYERIISGITRYLSNHALDAVELSIKQGERVLGMTKSFYCGMGGIGLILNEIYRLYRNEEARKGAKKILEFYRKEAIQNEKGIYWTDNAQIYFDSGVILFLIDACMTYEGIDQEWRPLVVAATDYILANGIRHGDGGLEIDRIQLDFKHKEPNFEFGTAGVGFLFLKVYKFTKQEKYLAAAKAAAVYLKSIAVPQKEGYLIPYKLGKYDDLFYLGNCHGPAGTAKLFYELYEVTNEQQYLDDAIGLCMGAESLGVPYSQSAGFWNTTCVCCGPAGYIPLYIGMYLETRDEKWKNMAHDVGEILIGEKSSVFICKTRASRWNIAFDRTKPEVITSPAGYFPGAAGIAAQLLLLYSFETGKHQITGLIDDPYRKRERMQTDTPDHCCVP